MKNFRRTLFVDLKKAFMSPAIYIVILLLTAIHMTDILPLCTEEGVSICDAIYRKAGGAGALCLLGFCVSILPFTLQYLKETDNNCIYNYINRSDIFAYSVSKIISVCVTTFIAVAASNIICLFIFLLMGMSVSNEFFRLNYQDAHDLIKNGNYIIFIVFIILIEAFRSVFFSIVSLCMSAFIKNKFLIVSLPVIFYFGVGSFLFFYVRVPDWLNLSVIYQPMTINAPNDINSFLLTLIVTLFMIAVFGAVFIARVRRCVGNGKF